ncbi:MAG: CPBP family glutamic-type intramembrane protease, partial [Planctomycetota bacterium]
MKQRETLSTRIAPLAPYVTFIGPLVVYFAAGALISKWWSYPGESDDPSQSPVLAIAQCYGRIVLVGCLFALVMSRLRRAFPLSVSGWSIVAGCLGAVVWIGLCRFDLEIQLIASLGLSTDWLSQRDAIDPWSLYPTAGLRWLFLAGRFAVLVLVVPLAEELFLRGFFIRSIEHEDWKNFPLDQIGITGIVAASVYGVLTHP